MRTDCTTYLWKCYYPFGSDIQTEFWAVILKQGLYNYLGWLSLIVKAAGPWYRVLGLCLFRIGESSTRK